MTETETASTSSSRCTRRRDSAGGVLERQERHCDFAMTCSSRDYRAYGLHHPLAHMPALRSAFRPADRRTGRDDSPLHYTSSAPKLY